MHRHATLRVAPSCVSLANCLNLMSCPGRTDERYFMMFSAVIWVISYLLSISLKLNIQKILYTSIYV